MNGLFNPNATGRLAWTWASRGIAPVLMAVILCGFQCESSCDNRDFTPLRLARYTAADSGPYVKVEAQTETGYSEAPDSYSGRMSLDYIIENPRERPTTVEVVITQRSTLASFDCSNLDVVVETPRLADTCPTGEEEADAGTSDSGSMDASVEDAGTDPDVGIDEPIAGGDDPDTPESTACLARVLVVLDGGGQRAGRIDESQLNSPDGVDIWFACRTDDCEVNLYYLIAVEQHQCRTDDQCDPDQVCDSFGRCTTKACVHDCQCDDGQICDEVLLRCVEDGQCSGCTHGKRPPLTWLWVVAAAFVILVVLRRT